MTKKLSTTPTATIARALTYLGLKQGLDFRVAGVYVNGERIRTVATIFGFDACEKVIRNSGMVTYNCAKYGHTFHVRVYGAQDVTVQN